MAEFRKCFHAIDVNDTGCITLADLRNYMQKMNYTEKFIKSWIKLFNLTEDGTITYDHFCKTLGLIPRKHEISQPVSQSNVEPEIESIQATTCTKVREPSESRKKPQKKTDACTSEVEAPSHPKEKQKKSNGEKKKPKKKKTNVNDLDDSLEQLPSEGVKPLSVADLPRDQEEVQEITFTDAVPALLSEPDKDKLIDFTPTPHSPIRLRSITPVLPEPIKTDFLAPTVHAPVQLANGCGGMNHSVEADEPIGLRISVDRQPANPDLEMACSFHEIKPLLSVVNSVAPTGISDQVDPFGQDLVVPDCQSALFPETAKKQPSDLQDNVLANSYRVAGEPKNTQPAYSADGMPSINQPTKITDEFVVVEHPQAKPTKSKPPKTKLSDKKTQPKDSIVNKCISPDSNPTNRTAPKPVEEAPVTMTTYTTATTPTRSLKDNPEVRENKKKTPDTHSFEEDQNQPPVIELSNEDKPRKKKEGGKIKTDKVPVSDEFCQDLENISHLLYVSTKTSDRRSPGHFDHISSKSAAQTKFTSLPSSEIQRQTTKNKKKRKPENTEQPVVAKHPKFSTPKSVEPSREIAMGMEKPLCVSAAAHEDIKGPFLSKQAVRRSLKKITAKVRKSKKLGLLKFGQNKRHSKAKNETEPEKEKPKKPRFPRGFVVQPDARRAEVERNRREFLKSKFIEHKCPDRSAPKPILRAKRVPSLDRRWKVRESLRTRGSVLILLGGNHRGKRVIYLGRQRSTGLLLVTGPFKYNGCPLRRVHPNMVIVTKTRINLKQFSLPKRVHQLDYFARSNKRHSKKDASFMVDQTQDVSSKLDKFRPNEQRKEDQLVIDREVCARIKTHPDSKFLIKYLKSLFCLSKNEKPHRMIF